jgi:HAE1 family hydrophobic/amphiphilic exporter-1
MFVDFFIHRPIFSTVCALLIILAGAVAIPSLPVAQYPNLSPPRVTVSSFYNGANAQTVESAVTTLLEQAINGSPGMKYMTSTSGNDGSSNIVATFDVNRDIDLAAVDVQNRINGVIGRLPNEVKNTGIGVSKSAAGWILAAGFYTLHGEYDPLFISNYLDLYVRDALKRIPGVADVFIFGERKYAMRLWLDPLRLAGRALTAADVVNALEEQNVNVAAGQLGQPPAGGNQAFQISVRALGRLTEPAEFENIVLKSNADGTLVRLKDVGRAELGAEDYSSNLRFNGYDTVGVAITHLPTANALEVDKQAKAELARLSRRFPPGLKYAIAFDTTTVVSESIRDVLWTLLQAIALVLLVIFVFLQEWRSTLIPAVTIPVSLVGTFAFVKLLGFSINTLTLFGLTLATGLVVDDAIVVIENVERHIRQGQRDAHRAASEAMGEVAGAVVATSLVLIAVFVPVALFPGTTGILFRQFALTIAFSVAISAFNALTLSPALAALLLGRGEAHGRFFRLFNRIVAAGTEFYQTTVGFALRHRMAVFVAFLGCAFGAYSVFQRVPQAFVPDEDQGYLMVVIQAPPGASLEYTGKIADRAAAVIAKVPEVDSNFAISGFGASTSAPNFGINYASLKEIADRPGEEHAVAAVVERLRGPLSQIPGAVIVPFSPPPIEGLSTYGGFQFVVEDRGGGTVETLAEVVQNLSQSGNESKIVGGLFSTFTANDPQYQVTMDREKARSLGVPLTQINEALSVYMGSVYVNDFDFNNRAYRVYVQADRAFRSQPRDIGQYYVRTDRGAMVPLENLVRVQQTTNAQVISHYNLFRATEIDGGAQPGHSSGEAIREMEALAKRALPPSFGYEWTGLSLEEIESGSTVALLFGLGALVVYLTLAAQYESFTLPFIVMLAVPAAVLGALVMQAARGLSNDIYCQIGLVMLVGLSTKNAILIVEFAEQLREKGRSIVEATIEAARIRLRPILMTSLAFILGVLPLVFAQGAGREGRHSVGTTVLGGMLAATTLNLIFIPVLYLLVKGRGKQAASAGARGE